MAQQPASQKRWWQYFARSLRLRCPECGISPIFMSVRQTESLTDWFAHHAGCPRCGYEYDREPGYFLYALWQISFIVSGVGGIILLLYLDAWFDLSTAGLLIFTIFPVVIINILLIRHIKAFYLAIDHYIHPHTDDDPLGR